MGHNATFFARKKGHLPILSILIMIHCVIPFWITFDNLFLFFLFFSLLLLLMIMLYIHLTLLIFVTSLNGVCGFWRTGPYKSLYTISIIFRLIAEALSFKRSLDTIILAFKCTMIEISSTQLLREIYVLEVQ